MTPRCCLVIGHRPSSPGAVSVGGVSEYQYNSGLAEAVKEAVCPEKCEVEVVYRDDDGAGYDKLPHQINEHAPNFIISLHFNAAESKRATGSEVLCWHSSSEGKRLATFVLTRIQGALTLPSRGVKGRDFSGRGGHLLGRTAAPCVIAEPFFGSNPVDWERGSMRKDALLIAYKKAIEDYAELIGDLA